VTGILVTTRAGSLVPASDDTFASLGLVDLHRLRFRGTPRPGQSFSGNFIECLFEGAKLENINFSRCDWKDCHLSETTFVDCDLGSASIITNSFESCRFIRCRFSDTGISDCIFNRCAFEHCDLSNIVMKSNNIDRSSFSSCKTSNKIIEGSVLIDTKWTDMAIEIGTILGNFGLRQSEFENCTLYVKLANRDFKAMDWGEISALKNNQEFSPVEHFRLSYFEFGTADGDADVFENVLNPRNWSGDAIIEASFSALLTKFTQFLTVLYSSNRLATYAILRFHTYNFELLEWLADRPELPTLYQTAAGVHLTLTREVDKFAVLLQSLVDAHEESRKVRIEAEGPLERSYYEHFFAELGVEGLRIESVRPRNSPVELLVAFFDYTTLMTGIALVLAVRTKIELLKVPRVAKAPSGSRGVRAHTEGGRELISFQSGFMPDRPSNFQINVRTLLPRSLLLDLHLSFSVAVFKKVRSILLGLLQPSDPANPA
jgi:uncharacterized protein YjbI with pentapeptide repeats